ncbi:hypothetical protein SAMN06314019_11010 [Epsilonproteobacteria bacterium SCGC AD-311-C15]|jgi:hypothetical protein|nr:hypothetical protein SAMN06314019_11010 [Epsilonproteobacteria bacterium SCGC AD-311-C15]
MESAIEFNKLFGFFLNKKGLSPHFRKTNYGYRTFDNTWKLFINSLSIVHTIPAKVYNGYNYDNGIEETKYEIVKMPHSVDVHFIYKKLI